MDYLKNYGFTKEDIKEINLVIKSELKFLEEMLAKKSN